MLSLIFSRATKRRMVGLLALGEWGPASGEPAAITGSIASEQARQESILTGTVADPVVQVDGGGGWVYPLRGHPSTRSWFDPLRRPQNTARTEISGSITSQQARQQSLAVGTVVNPVEIPVLTVTVTSEALEAMVRSLRGRGRQEITVSGDTTDPELLLLTALLMAAD